MAESAMITTPWITDLMPAAKALPVIRAERGVGGDHELGQHAGVPPARRFTRFTAVCAPKR